MAVQLGDTIMMYVLESETSRLLQSLEKVVSEWAFLSLDLLGEPAPRPTQLPLERRVRLLSPGSREQAELVLRGSQGLGLELARSVRGLPAANLPAAEAAFTELCALLAEEWRQRLRQETGVDLIPGPPEPSTTRSWLASSPSAAFAAVIRGFAVEARLWRAASIACAAS